MKGLSYLLLAAALLLTACVKDDGMRGDPMRIGAFLYDTADPVLAAQLRELEPVLGLAQYDRIFNGKPSQEITPEQVLAWYLPGATLRQEGDTWHILQNGRETVVNTGGKSLFTDTGAVWTYNTDGSYFEDALPSVWFEDAYRCRISLPTRQNRANFVIGEFTFSRSFLIIMDLITSDLIAYAIETTTTGSGSVVAEDMHIGIEITEPLVLRSHEPHFHEGKLLLTARDGQNTDVVRVEYSLPVTWIYYADYYKEYLYE